jgi:hypothetical protein
MAQEQCTANRHRFQNPARSQCRFTHRLLGEQRIRQGPIQYQGGLVTWGRQARVVHVGGQQLGRLLLGEGAGDLAPTATSSSSSTHTQVRTQG